MNVLSDMLCLVQLFSFVFHTLLLVIFFTLLFLTAEKKCLSKKKFVSVFLFAEIFCSLKHFRNLSHISTKTHHYSIH